MIKTIRPTDISPVQFQALLQGSIAPRPIALVSSINLAGEVNLSPFSFFNVFSSNPPILIFSPARRVRDNTIKHTLENVYEVPEVVIGVVSSPIVEQVSLASTEYERGINEFVKAGLSQVPSELVRPPRIAESLVNYECKVRKIIPLGSGGGAGNLVVCEVILAHFSETIFDENQKIDPQKIALAARMGGDFYSKTIPESTFEVEKPLVKKGIGIDQLPENIKNSPILTGSQLAQLANIEALPNKESLKELEIENIAGNSHQQAAFFLAQKQVLKAWKVLLG